MNRQSSITITKNTTLIGKPRILHRENNSFPLRCQQFQTFESNLLVVRQVTKIVTPRKDIILMSCQHQ